MCDIAMDQFCDCFSAMDEFKGEGKILGVHLTLLGSGAEDGCGGYITDKMLEAHNPDHYKLKSC